MTGTGEITESFEERSVTALEDIVIILKENQKNKEIVEKIREQELQTREYYEKMRKENPMFEEWITDIIRHCNGQIKILGES